jgi:hypothetical protein
MWRSLKNFFYSLWTYADLSPNLAVRRRVKKNLRTRPLLNPGEWHQKFWQSQDISRKISDFVYTQLQHHSGLELGRVCPSDRLNEDLHLAVICWFDWELSFCEAFLATFGIDLGDRFNLDDLSTIEDLVIFLNQQLFLINCY